MILFNYYIFLSFQNKRFLPFSSTWKSATTRNFATTRSTASSSSLASTAAWWPRRKRASSIWWTTLPTSCRCSKTSERFSRWRRSAAQTSFARSCSSFRPRFSSTCRNPCWRPTSSRSPKWLVISWKLLLTKMRYVVIDLNLEFKRVHSMLIYSWNLPFLCSLHILCLSEFL